MRIAVASGKGGTGKTTVAASLAVRLGRRGAAQYLDCDVEAPNGALFLRPEMEGGAAVTVAVPEVEEGLCRRCGVCSRFCRSNALAVTAGGVMVFGEMCKGCGGCVLVCPEGAMGEGRREVGRLEWGRVGAVGFAHGMLNAGETATAQVVRAVRGAERGGGVVVIDCAPGTSCPVVAALEGVDFVMLVAEPTRFGLHDLALAVELTRRMGLRAGVVVNRWVRGEEAVERFCEGAGVRVMGRIADDRRVAEAYSRGELGVEAGPGFGAAMDGIAEELMAGVAG